MMARAIQSINVKTSREITPPRNGLDHQNELEKHDKEDLIKQVYRLEKQRPANGIVVPPLPIDWAALFFQMTLQLTLIEVAPLNCRHELQVPDIGVQHADLQKGLDGLPAHSQVETVPR